MLYFVYEELALGYLLFSFLSALGVLQCVAAHHGLAGLAFLNYSERRTWGYALGTFLIAGSAMWFFGSQWARILTPGPAGSELTLLFGAGAVGALVATLVAASLLQGLHKASPPQGSDDRSQSVAIGRATAGRLYLPTDPTAPMPAVCLVPGLGVGEESMDILARHFVEQRLVALVIVPDEEFSTYPETLAILPAATSLLSKRPDVDPRRLGALGYDLGGDLVIRSASVDKQLKAVAALAPVLIDPPVGLDLMSEMPFGQALRWARDRARAKLQTGLNALEYGTKITPRPFLLLYGAKDRLVTRAPEREWAAPEKNQTTHQAIQGAGHLNLLDHPATLDTVVRWFKEHL